MGCISMSSMWTCQRKFDKSLCTGADSLAGFDRNKRENVDDVGCVYNFESAEDRDRFYHKLNTDLERDKLYSSEPCVSKVWLWRMS